MTDDTSPTVGQKSATLTGQQAPLRPTAVPDVNPDDPPEEFADALEAEDFIVYGKASIEKFDTGGENSEVPEILDMEAMETALGRFFASEKAPGIISIGHDDIPVGRPLKEYTVDDAASIQIGDEAYEFEAGDTLTTHIEDGDGDGRPELWMLADLAKDTDIARKVRLGVLLGELDGFSVTFGRHADGVEPEGEGRRVTSFDLFSVTIAPGEMIANKGSEFDLAAFKAEMNRYAPTATADDATHEQELVRVAEGLVNGFRHTMNESDNAPDADTLLKRLGQKLTGTDDDESTDGEESGQKSNPDDDAGQKQPEGDEGDDGNAVEDLVRALADEIGADPDDLMAAIQSAGQNAADEGDEEEEDEDDEDVGQDATEGTDASVSIDFGKKAEEHGLVTEDALGKKFDAFRENVVEDLGQKLAETNEEAVEEIAQKMQATGTPNPAGGSFQDSEDFESQLGEIADGEDW